MGRYLQVRPARAPGLAWQGAATGSLSCACLLRLPANSACPERRPPAASNAALMLAQLGDEERAMKEMQAIARWEGRGLATHSCLEEL